MRTYSEQDSLASCLGGILKWQQDPAVAAFGPRMLDTRCGMLGDDVRRLEISDLQNCEGQHPLSAGPRAGYRRDWLIVWPLESARAHGGLTELCNADLTDTQIRALRGAISASRRSKKLCPFSATFCRPSSAIVGLNIRPGSGRISRSPPSGWGPDFGLTPRQVASSLGTAAGPLVAAAGARPLSAFVLLQ